MSIKSLAYEILYKNTCRTYAKWIVKDRPADRLLQTLCAFHFWRAHRFWPQFGNPRTFSEKVWNRMFFCRDARLIVFADKFGFREHVRSAIGEEHLIPLLWEGIDPDKIPYDQLPDKFVIKATHGSGFNIIVENKDSLDRQNAAMQLRNWLSCNYCEDHFLGIEWGYRHISPRIIVESFLEQDGKAPVDYKFFCFSGRAEFIQVDLDRFEGHTRKILDRNFAPLEVELGCKNPGRGVPRPENLDEMIRLADRLSQDVDFMRVDLYSVGNRIFVGELTNYPGGGTERFTPRKFDFVFGEKWSLKRS